MLDISKRYDISPVRMGRKPTESQNDAEQAEQKVLVFLKPAVLEALDKDAARCKRARLRQIEAILVAYLGLEDVDLKNIPTVREVVSKGTVAPHQGEPNHPPIDTLPRKNLGRNKGGKKQKLA